MLLIFPFIDAVFVLLFSLPLPPSLLFLPPFSLPFFSDRAPGVRPSDLNLSSAHIKAIGELKRPPLHPRRPLALLLLPSHPPVKLQTPLSCRHLFAFFCL